MAQELQYTSVPQGLKPGTRGFCAVVMTRGMSQAIADRLESLSGYDMFYRVGSPNIDENPPHFAHWMVDLDGKPAHVLSHVCYAGMDFNGRANKFAHHLYLDDADLTDAGPAWLMMQPGVVERAFVPPVRTVEPRPLPRGDVQPGACEAWVRAWGDAGWAGALAQQLLDDPAKPVYVIYPISLDPLPLVAEAISLLPDYARWRATFSTYFTRLPADMTCTWRFCIEGTDAAKDARAARGRALVIDFSGDRKTPPPGQLVTLARTGGIESPRPAAPVAPAPATPAAPLLVPGATQLPPSVPPELMIDISLPDPKAPRQEASAAGDSAFGDLELGNSPAGTSSGTAVFAPGGTAAGATSPGTDGRAGSAAGLPPTPPKQRHHEPTSMMDLGNEEAEAAELEDAMNRQKRAREIKTRSTAKPKASPAAAAAKSDDADDSKAGQEVGDASDSSVTQLAETDAQENRPPKSQPKPSSPTPPAKRPEDRHAATKPARETTTTSIEEAIAAEQPLAPITMMVPKRNGNHKPLLIAGAVGIVLLGVGAAILLRKPTVESSAGSSATTTAVNAASKAGIDLKLAPLDLKPLAVDGFDGLSAAPLNLTAPGDSSATPAVVRIGPALGATAFEWLVPTPSQPTQNSDAGSEPPPFSLDQKPARVIVHLPCEPSVAANGHVSLAELAIENDHLVWRWLYTKPWPENLREDWNALAPQFAQTLVELRDSSKQPLGKIQLCVPAERTLRPPSLSATFTELRPAGAASIFVAPLAHGWAPAGPVVLGSPLELTHPSGAKLTINSIRNRDVWTLLAIWPIDSQPDRLVASGAQLEREVAQWLGVKSSPALIAETQGDVNRLQDELTHLTTQIAQQRAAAANSPQQEKSTDSPAIQILRSRQEELTSSLKQLSESLAKMKAAPITIDALRAQRKNAAERLDAIKTLLQSHVVIASEPTHVVLARARLVNPAAPPDNAAPTSGP